MKDKILKLFVIPFALGALLGVSSGYAATVTVNYSADLTPVNPASPNAGVGTFSGSLGTFDVNNVGDQFELPLDGSIVMNVSGFAAGFPNGDFALTLAHGSGTRPPTLEFLSIGSTAEEFSVRFVDDNGGIFARPANPCFVAGLSNSCLVLLYDESSNGIDRAAASIGPGTYDNSIGDLNFSFEIHDAPAVVPLPATLPMAISGMLGILGVNFVRRRMQPHSKVA